MAADEPYDLMPHKQITDLKRQVQELKVNVNRASPKDLIDSMDSLTKAIDSLMKLFRQAAEELKYEDKESSFNGDHDHNVMIDKLDKIMEHNKIIADGMVAISDMVNKDMKHKPNFPKPQYQPPTPNFQLPPEPQLNQPPMPPRPDQPGPVAMPTVPLPDLEDIEPKKKKGLFGRFRK